MVDGKFRTICHQCQGGQAQLHEVQFEFNIIFGYRPAQYNILFVFPIHKLSIYSRRVQLLTKLVKLVEIDLVYYLTNTFTYKIMKIKEFNKYQQ